MMGRVRQRRLCTLAVILFVVFMSSCSTRNSDPDHDRADIETDADSTRTVDAKRLGKIMSLPYMRGSLPGRENIGVTVYEETRAWDGYNLYCSSHSPSAYLMTMQGEVIHTWHLPFEAVWPKQEILPENEGHDGFWRRVHMWENGDLLAVYSGLGLIKLDRDSRLIWSHLGGEHHDFEVAQDGTIYSLARRRGRYPGIKHPILEDFIHVLDPQGKLIKTSSLISCLKNSKFDHLLDGLAGSIEKGQDGIAEWVWKNIRNAVTPGLPLYIFHANTIEYLSGAHVKRSPVFAEGNLLLALRNLNTIVAVDLEKEKAVWAMWDRWHYPHQPTLLNSGNILIFDNLHTWEGSAVLEFDPLSGKEVWGFRGTADDPFFSPTQGSNQRLPNGNTLITDSNNGRAFEVTREGKIVWEFIHPHRVGNERELTANLCELIRLSPGIPLDWVSSDR